MLFNPEIPAVDELLGPALACVPAAGSRVAADRTIRVLVGEVLESLWQQSKVNIITDAREQGDEQSSRCQEHQKYPPSRRPGSHHNQDQRHHLIGASGLAQQFEERSTGRGW